VGDEQDRELPFGADAVELVVQQVPGHRVESAEGLVHQQDVGVLCERPGERDPLPHAAGKLVRPLPAEPAKVHYLEQLRGPLLALRPARADGPQGKLHVARGGQPGEQRRLLEHERHPRAGHRHLPGRRLLQAGDQGEQRGLAAARGADQAGEFPWCDLERDLVERTDGRPAAPEYLGHARKPDGPRAPRFL
jgi:hypothetical protein